MDKNLEKIISVDTSQVEDQTRIVDVSINPNTGEKQIINPSSNIDLEKSFEERSKKTIESISMDIEKGMSKTITTEEFTRMISEDNEFLKELTNGTDLSEEDIKGILTVTNKILKKEEVNAYKELPESAKKLIDNYINKEFKALPINQRNMVRKSVSKSIIDRFIEIIQSQRAKYDFAHALANIYNETNSDIEEAALEIHNERNKVYREIAEDIKDPEKKKRMIDILDKIDEAKNLSKLKEFAKKCKIKSIDLEKYKRIFSDFLNKYRESSNNIYDIDIAYKAILRNINKEDNQYTDREVVAFFVAFCKQVQNYDESNPLDHAYMYYVLYYSVLTDTEDSKEFLNNVKEVIKNIKERNPSRF